MLRSALVTILLNGGSSVLSFLNQLLIAAAFGAAPSLDAYFVGISVPSAVAANLNQMLVVSLVPVLVVAARKGHGAPLVSAFAIVYGALALVLAGVGLLAGPGLIARFGGSHAEGYPEIARLAFVLFSATGTALVLGGLLTAVSNTERSFVWPIVSAYGLPLGTMGAILLLRDRMGPPAIAVGALAGSTAGLVLLFVVLRHRFVRPPYGAETWRTVRATVARSPLFVLGLLPFSVLVVSDSFWGSRLGPSVVSHLGFANRVLVNLASVIMMGPVSVLAQRLSEHHSAADAAAFRRDYVRGIRILLWVGGHLCVLLAVLAEPAVRLLFQHGRFTGADTAAVAGLLRVMALGLMATNCAVLGFGALYARHTSGTASVLGVGLSLAYFVLSGALGRGLGLGASGVAWTYTLCWWAVTLITLVLLARGRLASASVLGEGARLVATLALSALATALVSAAIGSLGTSRGIDLLAATASAVVGTAVFGALAVGLFRNPEVGGLVRRLRPGRSGAA